MKLNFRSFFQRGTEEFKFLVIAFGTYTFGAFLIAISPWLGAQQTFIWNVGLSVCSLPINIIILRWWWGVKHDDSETKEKLNSLVKQVQVLQEQNSSIESLLQQILRANINSEKEVVSTTDTEYLS